jgi:hypothetical protein
VKSFWNDNLDYSYLILWNILIYLLFFKQCSPIIGLIVVVKKNELNKLKYNCYCYFCWCISIIILTEVKISVTYFVANTFMTYALINMHPQSRRRLKCWCEEHRVQIIKTWNQSFSYFDKSLYDNRCCNRKVIRSTTF